MSEMPDPQGRAYPWPAEGGEASPTLESDYMSESENGTTPDPGTESVLPDGIEALVVSDSVPSMNDSGREPAVPFLQSLIDAMRKIAEQTRDDTLGQLRATVAERGAAIRADTEKRAAELHELADSDVAGVATWEQGEIARIREEAAAKVSARNATLDAQLAANTAAGEGAMTAVEARVEAFEAEMTSFFAQLNDIQDPAQLASALKRIPTAPSLDAVAAPALDTAPAPAATGPEAATAPEATTAAASEVPAEPEPAAAPASEVASAAMPAQEASAQVDPDGEATSPSSVAVATAPAQAEEATAEPMAAEAATEPVTAEAATAPATATETPAAVPAESTEEATTQVLVTGLTSFGAITSFKQSLERVDGVKRVSLGLGTSGEFIFTAVHRAGFDLSAAIRSFEESAQFVASNGQLRVTVGSKA
jgi:hypothetical protein